MRNKIIMTTLCTLLLVAAGILGTLAYLTDRDSVTNTFTVGNIEIALDEAAVDKDGQYIYQKDGELADRVTGNKYHLVPGKTYIKDPALTVKAGSEESFVRLMVTITCAEELLAIYEEHKDAVDVNDIFYGYHSDIWVLTDYAQNESVNTFTLEFRYKEPVSPGVNAVTGASEDLILPPLFEGFTIPGALTKENLASLNPNADNEAGFQINVEGHAIQTAAFTTNEETGETAEQAAWAAFDKQYNRK